MRKFVKVPENAFKEMQLEAGLILNKFDPTGKTDVEDADIVCATTGGIEIVCKPTFTDFGDDIDNVPANTLEFKRVDGWDCHIGFTALNASVPIIEMALCAAKTEGNKITPVNDLDTAKAKDIWWVGARADGGFVACCLKNSLSTDGLSLKTTKKGKGNISCTLTGHISIKEQDVVPMDFYVQEGETAQEGETE